MLVHLSNETALIGTRRLAGDYIPFTVQHHERLMRRVVFEKVEDETQFKMGGDLSGTPKLEGHLSGNPKKKPRFGGIQRSLISIRHALDTRADGRGVQ